VLVFVPILVMLFVMGLYPAPFLNRMEPAVNVYLANLHQKMAAAESVQLSARSVRSDQLSALSAQPEPSLLSQGDTALPPLPQGEGRGEGEK
jgi:hypothetical protein